MGNSQSGFASLTPEARQRISAKGGRASARLRSRTGRKGFTAATAKEAGRRGGKATVEKHGHAYMRRIGGQRPSPSAAPAEAPSAEPREAAAESSPEPPAEGEPR